MSNIEMMSADRDDVLSTKFRSYKGKEGATDRVGLVFTDEQYNNGKKIYCGTKIHYKDKYFLCKSTKDSKAVCCTAVYTGNKPKWRMGAVIVKYDIQVKDGKPKLAGYELLPWVFGETIYNTLKGIDGEFSLISHDLKLMCKNEDYQNMEVTPCNDSIWRKNAELHKKILAEFPAVLEEAKGNLGQDLNAEEIREVLGIEAPGSQDAASEVSVGDVLEGV
jgi:hypothetical protein